MSSKQNIPSINIFYCGHEECLPGHFFGPATRPHYLIHFIMKGKGRYQTEGKVFHLKEGEAFLIKPYEVTYYEADEEEPWEYVWAAFDGEEADWLLEKYGMDGEQYTCSYDSDHGAKDHLYAMADIFLEGGYSRERLLGYFYLVFSCIVIHNMDGEKEYDRSYYQQAREYIRYNYGYSIQVSDIARHVGIDRTYLYKIFRKYGGVSPKQYLTAFRVEAARDMLSNTRLTITEIALSCGFHDSSVFCRNFSALAGEGPGKFRRRMRADESG